jgi:hypothetical protein
MALAATHSLWTDLPSVLRARWFIRALALTERNWVDALDQVCQRRPCPVRTRPNRSSGK